MTSCSLVDSSTCNSSRDSHLVGQGIAQQIILQRTRLNVPAPDARGNAVCTQLTSRRSYCITSLAKSDFCTSVTSCAWFQRRHTSVQEPTSPHNLTLAQRTYKKAGEEQRRTSRTLSPTVCTISSLRANPSDVTRPRNSAIYSHYSYFVKWNA